MVHRLPLCEISSQHQDGTASIAATSLTMNGDEKRLLENDPSLVVYTFFIHCKRCIQLFIDAIQGNTHLQTLRLILDQKTTAVSDSTVQALRSAIAQTRITQLILTPKGLGKPTSHFLNFVTLLLEAINDSPTIVDLEMKNLTKSYGMCARANCVGKLRSLTIKDMLRDNMTLKASARDIIHLSQSVTQLTKLSLSGTKFSGPSAVTLCERLARSQCLNTVVIKSCAVQGDAVEKFVEHWAPDSSIHTIEFPDNLINEGAAVKLIEAASNHQAMERLNLDDNFIGIDGLEEVALKLPNLALKELKMSGGKYEVRINDYRERVSQLMLQGIKNNLHLHTLDLSHHYIFDDDASEEEFEFWILRNRCARIMSPLLTGEHGDSHPQPAAIWCRIFAKQHPHNASIIYYFLKEQPALWPKRDEVARATTMTEGKRQRIE